MTKPLTLSNGKLFVGLSEHGMVKDIFFPYIGSEHHTPDRTHRIGVWVDGCLSWLDDESWSTKSSYTSGALIGHTISVNEALGVTVEFEDFVEIDDTVLIRNIHIVNTAKHQRSIRLFLHQAFNIGLKNNDTAQYLPADNSVLHYSGRRAFVVGGTTDVGQDFDQHSVGLYGNGLDGTWRDAEDGQLEGSDVGCGLTDSTIRFTITIGGLSSRRVHYWLAAGVSIDRTVDLARIIKNNGIFKRLANTTDWWHKWLAPSLKVSNGLSPQYKKPFIQGLMEIKAHADRRGCIIDDTNLQKEAYCAPRTAAYAIWPLARLGYSDDAVRFFTFCQKSLNQDGCLRSLYRADGAIAPSYAAYGSELPPTQSDQTALVLFVFAQVCSLSSGRKILPKFYESLVVPMADFLTNFTEKSGLPLPSYNFIESKSEVSTYTIAITYASLVAAAELADKLNQQERAVKWRTSAETMLAASSQVLINSKGLISRSVDSERVDIASLFGSFMFGLVEVDDRSVELTVKQIEQNLKRDDGLYISDQDTSRCDLVGSLWMAQYYMEAANSKEADRIISRVIEVIDSDERLASLTWTRAELVSSLLDFIVQNK